MGFPFAGVLRAGGDDADERVAESEGDAWRSMLAGQAPVATRAATLGRVRRKNMKEVGFFTAKTPSAPS
jgi:hypothetical protein